MRFYIILSAFSQGDHFFFSSVVFLPASVFDNVMSFAGLITFISGNSFIPFSTKYPELIIPDQRVCLPRISCQARIRGLTRNNL